MKTEFFVNKEKGKVVCKLDKVWIPGKGNCVIHGYAQCSSDDVFDENFGKKLAETRAHKEYHVQMRDASLKTVRSKERILKEARDKYDHHFELVHALKKKIKEMEGK